jgi:AraC-like DNA-binding protein
MELCYIDRGTVHWWVEREFHEVSGGHVYITWPHERHGGVGAALEPCKLYWMNLFLWPGGRSGKRTLLDLPPAEARLAVDALIQLPRCFAAPSTVGGAYHRILDTLLEPKTARGLLEVRSGLLEIITTLLRAANAVEHSEHSLMVREAMKLMENHLEEPLPLPEIARKLGWSPSHFKQRFRAEVGIPPAQFYLRRRITEACRRLQSSTNNVTRIGLDLGFQSGEYFATVFKRVTGLTPRTFRERAGRS